jgi:hypothetical protein
MRLKTFEIGGTEYAVVRDGKPVYVNDDGEETTLDAAELSATLAQITAEASGVRERLSAKIEELASEKITGAFARSPFVRDKLALPGDIAQSKFGSSFKVENGAVVAHDDSGAVILSTSRPGEPADFEEAIAALVNAYPDKDHILKGSGASGTGARTSAGGGRATTMTRAEFERLDPAAQHRTIMVDKIQLVD